MVLSGKVVIIFDDLFYPKIISLVVVILVVDICVFTLSEPVLLIYAHLSLLMIYFSGFILIYCKPTVCVL